MSTFEKFTHPKHGNDYVKQGFSFPAVILSVVWLGFRKLWVLFLVGVVGLIAAKTFTTSLMPPAAPHENPIDWFFLAILAGLGLVLGFVGNRLVAASLRRKGYEMVGTIETESINDFEDANSWP